MKEIIIFLIFVFIVSVKVKGNLPQPKVIGGFYAKPNQFPYEISLQNNYYHVCGGAILTKSFVLTAGHCVTNKLHQVESPYNYTIVAGTVDLQGGGHRFEVKSFIIHEKFRCCGRDIALIKLKHHFYWDDSIQPITLCEKEPFENEIVLISGWGATKDKKLSDKLKYSWFIVTSEDVCKNAFSNRYYKGLMCLDHPINAGSCAGDSGGPATLNGKLVGLTSLIYGPCASPKPDGYVKIFHFLYWIKDHIF